jgi:hypothetical protein
VTQTQDGSGAPFLQGTRVRVEAVASDMVLGANDVEADRTGPQPNDVVGGPCFDLVMHGSGLAHC